MLSFRDYLRNNKSRGTLTKLKKFQNQWSDGDYGPKNEPAPFSDANNLSGALALGMGGEGEEVPRKKGVNRYRPKGSEQEINTKNLVPGDAQVQDRSYEEDRGDSAMSNNHAEEDPDRKNASEHPDKFVDEPVSLNGIGDETQQAQDPNKEGLIRRVPGAHLVYKRKVEDGTYNELWVYKIQKDIREDAKVREQILAGTDIPIQKMQSDDGTQTYDLWTIGDVQMMSIAGLPN